MDLRKRSACAVHTIRLLETHLPQCLGDLAVGYAGDLDNHVFGVQSADADRRYSVSFPCRDDCKETNCIGFNSQRMAEPVCLKGTPNFSHEISTDVLYGTFKIRKTISFRCRGGEVKLRYTDGDCEIQDGPDRIIFVGPAYDEFMKKAFEIVKAYLDRHNKSS